MPKIHSIRENDIEDESEIFSFQAGRSHAQVSSITKQSEPANFCRPPLVKQYFNSNLKCWVDISLHPDLFKPEIVPEVSSMDQGQDDKFDIRPHILDPVMGHLLCDSGSMVSAFPPEPGDKPLAGHYLKAANGSKMRCFGYKKIEIKINRKTYPFKIIKAEVESQYSDGIS